MSTGSLQPSVALSTPLASRIRWVAVRGLAAVAAGALVLGIGGRLVMLASRLLHPEAAGRFTENGNRIGDFTVGGTIALVIFGGLLGGLVAGVVWVFVKEWIPDNPLVVGLGTVAIGGFALVAADNPDFVILVEPRVDLALLLLLLFGFGVCLHWLDHALDRRLPSSGGIVSTVIYTLLAALGAPFVVLAFGNFFTGAICSCESPPVWTGGFLIVAAGVSLTWWVLELRGASGPPALLQRLGHVSVAGAAVAGGVYLVSQLVAIL